MVRSQKVTGRTSSIPAGLAAGAAVSTVVTGIGTVLLALLLDRETISWEAIGYGILTMILLAAYLGALCAYSRIRRRKAAVCFLSGLTYFGILLMVTALFFGGQYEAVGVTGLLVAGGSGCAAITGIGQGRGGRRPRPGIRYR